MPSDSPDTEGLTVLGEGTQPSKELEAFPNRSPDRYYLVTLETDEFTCLCPKTGQPDFASILIEYVPHESVIESKSLKLYLWSYRNEGAFHEHVVNQILDDFVKAARPHFCRVTGRFNVRGGIGITVQSEDVSTAEAKRAIADSLSGGPSPRSS